MPRRRTGGCRGLGVFYEHSHFENCECQAVVRLRRPGDFLVSEGGFGNGQIDGSCSFRRPLIKRGKGTCLSVRHAEYPIRTARRRRG